MMLWTNAWPGHTPGGQGIYRVMIYNLVKRSGDYTVAVKYII